MDKAFWMNNYKVLFNKDKLLEIWPYSHMSYNEKMNATTRFIIYSSLLGYIFLNNYIIILLGFVLVLTVLFIYKYNKVEYFTSMAETSSDEGKHTRENPLYNVLNSDYVDNVNKEGIQETYDEKKSNEINHQVKQFIYKTNETNKDIGSIFNNLSDNINFESSMRQFHINPSTTIPNDQGDFLNYCYGNLHSEKPLLIY